MNLNFPENLSELTKSLERIDNPFRRQLAVGSVITKLFEDNNLSPPVIVGGSAVALYSFELYKTYDLDMKSEEVESYTEILEKMGYSKLGKDFFNKSLDSYVEFPSGRMEDSQNHIRKFVVEETGFSIYVVGFEDIILDRVCSFHATDDQKSREWALRLMGFLYKEIDWSYLHKRANQLGILKAVEKLQREVKRYKDLYASFEGEPSASSETEFRPLRFFDK